jgi:hypothetical protein
MKKLVSTVGSKADNPKDWNYPCLGIGKKGRIVLFNDYEIGTVVVDINNVYGIGFYTDDWDMEDFELYDGPVTLEMK